MRPSIFLLGPSYLYFGRGQVAMHVRSTGDYPCGTSDACDGYGPVTIRTHAVPVTIPNRPPDAFW